MRRFFILLASIAMVLNMQAQSSRDFIKQAIRKKNDCKTVAITKHNGDAMIYGNNGWGAKDCPSKFVKSLKELNDNDVEIKDIHLTEEGKWLILYGNNGMHWDGIYDDLLDRMIKYNTNGEEITTVTFNDNHDWILVTTQNISASSSELLNWLGEGCEKYGQLWTACLTDDAVVAVYQEGYKFSGQVPEDLKRALKECTSMVYNVKIAGNAWFFKCTDGHWRFCM